MTTNFEEAVDITLKNEGGLSLDKNDPGGYTNYGISLRFLQDNNIDINKDGTINGKDILDLTLEEAISIYKNQFWDKFNISSIKNHLLADKVFDLSVNMGAHKAIILLQKVINFQVKIRIPVDGVIGAMTLSALNSVDIPLLMKAYKKLACNFYESLVEINPNLQRYLRGWMLRANQ